MNVTPPDQRGYVDSSVLVTTDWLEARLDDPGVRIVDTDLPDQYVRAHIPGAVPVIDHYYKTSMEDRTHIQGPEQFASTMSSLGIGDDTQVVAYDSSGCLYGFRLAWSLHYYGHTNVKVLDGGFPKWFEENRPLSREIPSYPAAQFSPRPHPEIMATRERVLEAIGDTDTVLLDVRSDEEWTGENKRGTKRGGRMPGSVHLEWTNLLTEGDVPVLLPADELRRILADHGITPDKNVVTY